MLSLPIPRRRLLLALLVRIAFPVILVPVLAIGIAVKVTPAQRTTIPVINQEVEVGSVFSFSLSGPGQLLIGGHAIPIRRGFEGLIRPKFEAAHIGLLPSQSTNFLQRVASDQTKRTLIERLRSAFHPYFRQVIEWTIFFSALLTLGWATLLWQLSRSARFVWLAEARLLDAALLRIGGVTVLAAAVTFVSFGVAYSSIISDSRTMAGIPNSVNSLDQLVGVQPPRIQPVVGPKLRGYNLVVLGDSTAAGTGNPLVANPSPVDRVCGRSVDSFAQALALAGGYRVLNLACSGAKIIGGLFHAEEEDGIRVPSQLGALRRVQLDSNSAIIVDIGADDVQWQTNIAECIVSPCNDKATAAIFDAQLDNGLLALNDLLGRLANWPGHPYIIVNLYYNPLSPDVSCLAESPSVRHVTSVSSKDWQGRVAVLTQRLSIFNAKLAEAAKKAGVATVQPNFTGHAVCSSQPYVQSVDSVAPLHPNSEGQQAIATADALSLLRNSVNQ